MNKSKKVSVIVPVYKVEEYLSTCIDSLVNQTYENLDIICVNDCSPDSCSKILEIYANKDSRISIVNHNCNRGLSAARNTGMKIAKGDYIYFLDSDDWIDLDYIEKMVDAMEISKADLVVNINIVLEENGVSNCKRFDRYKEISSKGQFVNAEESVVDSPCMTWASFYSRYFLQKYRITFPEGYIHEDNFFHYVTHAYLDRVYVFQGSGYHYLQREGSIIREETNRDLYTIKIYNHILDYFIEHNLLNKRDIKMFDVQPYIMINSKEKYDAYYSYFVKLKDHLQIKIGIYNELELYFANSILCSKGFDDYKNRHGKNVIFGYLRHKKIKI